MTESQTTSPQDARSSACGENASSNSASRVSMTAHDPDAPGSFPPELVVRVKAIACDLPARLGLPLSRWSLAELASHLLPPAPLPPATHPTTPTCPISTPTRP